MAFFSAAFIFLCIVLVEGGRHEDLVIEYNGIVVHQGTELTPAQTRLPPSLISWPTEAETLYTLLVTDADVPSNVREINHWLIVNIAGKMSLVIIYIVKHNFVCRH